MRNQVRIIGGSLRSRLIRFPSIEGLRPTSDRIRETLFNWLGQSLEGKTCLDLFAGSGALGFEALSRGATKVVMVESNREAVSALGKNAQSLQVANLEIFRGDAIQYLLSCPERFDVVFVDPPFSSNLMPAVMSGLPRVLAKDAIVYTESPVGFDLGPEWLVIKYGKTSHVKFQLLLPITS